jgi:hypothetical protein
MSDTDQEHAEHDPSFEIVDLEPSESAHAIAESNRGLSRHAAKHLSGLQFLRERRKTRLAVTSVIAVIGLVVLLSVSGVFSSLFATLAHPSDPSTVSSSQSELILTSHIGQEDGLSCLMDAAWSPDSSQVAVLGYANDCPNPQHQYEPGLLNLYNAHTTKLIAHLHPDIAILSAFNKQFAQTKTPVTIYYNNVLWSPDGRYLALPFNVGSFPGNSAPIFDGLLLISQNGKQRVFLHRDLLSSITQSYVIWDVRQGITSVPYAGSSQSSNSENIFTLPTALTYHWSADGQLLPGIPVPSGSSSSVLTSSSGPIGNPDGSSSFSIWQPGTATWTAQNGNGAVHLPGVYLWQTYFTAWSPDGRYLIYGLTAGSLLHIPGQKAVSQQALNDLGVDQYSTIQVRNTTFIHLLRSLSSSTGSPSGMSVNVSWRPDGRVVATDAAGTVNIYDCNTGQKLAALIPQHLYPLNLDGGTGDVLRWSPDGSHLLLASTTWGLSIWGPSQLPN